MHRHRQQVGADGDQRAARALRIDQRRHSVRPARWRRGGCDDPRRTPVRQAVAQVGRDDLDTERLGAVASTAAVWVKTSASTSRRLLFDLPARRQVIASAARGASSSIGALASSRPVVGDHGLGVEQRLEPAWLISGWYGV